MDKNYPLKPLIAGVSFFCLILNFSITINLDKMEARDLHYSEVLEFSHREGLSIDSEDNYKEARSLLFDHKIKVYAVQNNCDYETAKERIGEDFRKSRSLEVNAFQERRERRIERFRELADKNLKLSDFIYQQAKTMSSVIPFGQPVLVGHHSERRDRNYRDKIHNTFGKSIELGRKAEYFENRASVIENNTAVSSDDPEAILKLSEKLQELEEAQKTMKEVNKILKAKKKSQEEKIKSLSELKLSEKEIMTVITPDRLQRVGFPAYALQNNLQNIKRIKHRITDLQRRRSEETTAKEINGIRIVDNVDANRLQLFFPGKPSKDKRKELRSAGFRYSGTNGCWQAFRNRRSSYMAESLVKGEW
jgi:hypothetical protein